MLRRYFVRAAVLCLVAGVLGAALAAAYLYHAPDKRRLAIRTGARVLERADDYSDLHRIGEHARRWWSRLTRHVTREPYPLDDASRIAVPKPGGGLICPDVALETYRGETLGYKRAVTVNPHFRQRLARLEAIAARVGREVYGRAPTRVLHFGTYNCRPLRHKKYRLSEHAFGNAIDIAGFEFDALPAAQRDELGRAGGRFEVSVLKHWDSETGFSRRHSVFLKRFVQELSDDDVFRGMLVPPAAGHDDHFHLDMGWFSYFNGDPSLPQVD